MTKPIKSDKESPISNEQYNALKNEYDQFVYMVSHDLNSPFRHIKGFVDILTRNLDDETMERNKVFVDAINNSTTKCEAMLDALLQFSRIQPTPEGMESYDLGTAVTNAQKRMASNPQYTNAVFEVDKMPSVNGYWQHLNELFYQLICNAVKFQPDVQTAHVKITAHDDGGKHHVINITDNGIGIAPKHNEDIFTMFRRLNHEADYPGIGAGLAYCHKIIKMHGGTIAVEQTDDGKTCFSVLLPK